MSCGQPTASASHRGARRHCPGVQRPWEHVSKRGRGLPGAREPGQDQTGQASPLPHPCPLSSPPSVAYPLPRASSAPSVEAQDPGNGGDPGAPVRNGAGEESAPPHPLDASGSTRHHDDDLLSLTSISSSPRSPQTASSPELAGTQLSEVWE